MSVYLVMFVFCGFNFGVCAGGGIGCSCWFVDLDCCGFVYCVDGCRSFVCFVELICSRLVVLVAAFIVVYGYRFGFMRLLYLWSVFLITLLAVDVSCLAGC